MHSEETLKDKLKNYISYDFNINLYGSVGCGKTTVIEKVFEELSEDNNPFPYVHFKISDFINMRVFYTKFLSFLESHVISGKLDKKHQVTKFEHLYEQMQALRHNNKLQKFTIIIDDIYDIQCLAIIKKQFNKVFTLCNDFELKIILISTFNVVKSEISLFCDLSTFISVDFPIRTQNEVKEIIKRKFPEYLPEIEKHFLFGFNNINFYTNNLNECIYFFGEYLEQIKTDSALQSGGPREVLINGRTFEKADLSNSTRQKVTNLCHNSIIHLKENYSKVESNMTSIDLLTDNLSVSQKLMLLAAFFAGETNPRFDSKMFKNVKKVKARIVKKQAKSIKSKNINNFTINRLLAIFASLYELKNGREQCFDCVDVELMADFNNLVQNNLLKFISNTAKEPNLFARKLITTISYEFAEKLAMEFGIKIEDFINPDS